MLTDEIFRSGGDFFEFPKYIFVDRNQRDFEGLGQAHIINHVNKKGTKDLSSCASWFRIFILKDSSSPKRSFLVKAN